MPGYYYDPFGSNGNVYEKRQAEIEKLNQKNAQKREIRFISFTMGCAIMAYILIQNIAGIFLKKLNLYELYQSNPAFNYSFYVLFVAFLSVLVPFGIMALVNKKRYAHPIIPKKALKPAHAVAWIGFGMGCCTVANYVVSIIITIAQELTGYKLEQGDMTRPDSVFSCILLVVCLSVMPGICEELAMRCFSLQLLRKYGKGFAVFAVAIVFGLLHGNVAQFIFAFSVGSVLGYITVKTDSIVPAVFIHALNNGASVAQYVSGYFGGKAWSERIVVSFYVFWLVFAVGSAIYLALNRQFKKSDLSSDSQSVLTTGEKFTAFLFPWMIVPFGVLILLTIAGMVM